MVVRGKETEWINRLLILVMISYGHYTETSKTKASRPKENIESNILTCILEEKGREPRAFWKMLNTFLPGKTDSNATIDKLTIDDSELTKPTK